MNEQKLIPGQDYYYTAGSEIISYRRAAQEPHAYKVRNFLYRRQRLHRRNA